MALEVRAERTKQKAHDSRYPPTTAAPTVYPTVAPPSLRVNKLSVRLMLGGSGCALCGIWWFIDGVTGAPIDAIIGGLVWKGPLLIAAGVGAAYYGFRIMTDPGPTDPPQPKSGQGV